ncbi:protein of unknown function DUF427 [Gloeothece citriformis PCC 7424]|uniref:DUF427 domain-containing protein n=1 Tax=Gloeothece citriformis (strain PCC 7424) TaxID=65393 RepID=B7K888_GLOC7|nr:DUF427 domain-containing protein [Gloeothece citriformis]ACK69848.1 protein of unknown function DUF427 [Gloeothece citriformis PCC 7424]
MPQAIWNGAILAQSDNCEVVEGNYYFPPDSINKEYFKESSTHTSCPWKGQASYYTIEVDGQQNKDAAWYYPNPKEKANNIKNYVAFWRGVTVKS